MNENYIPLYRKYRPQTLEEIVGQEHIKKALANTIKLNKISHAYLFTGPRGTGKTSTARILAKSLKNLMPISFASRKPNCRKDKSNWICQDIINIGITLNARATRERQFLRNTNLNRSATESKTANSIMKAELSLWNMQVFILSAATRQIRSQNSNALIFGWALKMPS